MDQVDMLVREHLEPDVAERLASAIRQAKIRPVLSLTDATHGATFGLLLLRHDGLEFLAADGRTVLPVRDDIVLADPRHRGTVAVTFSDGQELTFDGIGDATWTRQFAQAINDHANEGAASPLPPVERSAAVLTGPLQDPQHTRHQAALYVAVALKLCAVLVVLGGIVVAIGGADEVSDAGGSTSAFAASTIAAATLSALVLAFFGYALEVLVDIWENTQVTRTIAERG